MSQVFLYQLGRYWTRVVNLFVLGLVKFRDFIPMVFQKILSCVFDKELDELAYVLGLFRLALFGEDVLKSVVRHVRTEAFSEVFHIRIERLSLFRSVFNLSKFRMLLLENESFSARKFEIIRVRSNHHAFSKVVFSTATAQPARLRSSSRR